MSDAKDYWHAARRCDVVALHRELVWLRASVNDVDPATGCTALHYAVKKCSVKCVSLLLRQKSIDVNKRVKGTSETALHLAVTTDLNGGSPKGLKKIIEALLLNGADIGSPRLAQVGNGIGARMNSTGGANVEDGNESTPLQLACAHMPYDIVELLLNHPQAHKTFRTDMLDLLKIAIKNDNFDSIKALLDHDYIVERSSDRRFLFEPVEIVYFVEIAGECGNLAVIKFLFDKFAEKLDEEIHELMNNGDRMLAAAVESQECLRYLLEEKQCVPHSDDGRSLRAISEAIQKRVDLPTFRMLLGYIPEEIVDTFNTTKLEKDSNYDAVSFAAGSGDARYLDALVEHGFNRPKITKKRGARCGFDQPEVKKRRGPAGSRGSKRDRDATLK